MKKPATLPNPRAAALERDRTLALAVLSLGEEWGAQAAVAEKYGTDRRTVNRAVQSQGDWARAELARRKEAEKQATESKEDGNGSH